MTAFYFTFGVGSPLARYHVQIDAVDEYAARALMVGMFSRHWAFVYTKRPAGSVELEHVNRQASVRLGTNFEALDHELYSLAYTSGRVVNRP